MQPTMIIFIIALGYFLGSFPTAYLVARFKGIDIFKVGSGNMGAANVNRACGTRYGALVWIIDGFKGALAVLLARWLVPDHQALAGMLAAIFVVAGHNWSFVAALITGSIRGGKGAATASGTLILLAPTLLLALVLALGVSVVLLTRYISLGVLIAVAAAGIGFVALAILKNVEPVYMFYLLVSIMIFFQHRTNIVRLLTGTERRIGEQV